MTKEPEDFDNYFWAFEQECLKIKKLREEINDRMRNITFKWNAIQTEFKDELKLYVRKEKLLNTFRDIILER